MQILISKNDFKNIVAIALISIAALSLLIANPGFYSHDELQKLDHVLRYGFDHYLLSYVRFYQGDAFGVPVRPLSFFFQGVLALWMRDYVPFVHLWAVLTNVLVAGVGYILLRQFSVSSRISFWTALVFCLNPVAIMTTGWSAALMDRLYFLFALCALLFSCRFVRPKASLGWVVLIFCASIFGMSSKETFIVSPLLLGLLLFKNGALVGDRRFWVAMAVWIAPIVAFLGYRLPALVTSFNNPSVGAYNAVFGNIPDNFVVYFAYPFLVFSNEAHTSFLAGYWWLLFAISLHGAVMVFLWRSFGIKNAFAYLGGYFLFLVPVILIGSKGTHYLYASSSFLALAVVLLIAEFSRRRYILALVGCISVFFLSFHSVNNLRHIYDIGVCFNRIAVSAVAGYQALGAPNELVIEYEKASPDYVLKRFFTGREQIDRFYPVKIIVVDKSASDDGSGGPELIMNSECVLVPRL